MPLRHRLRTAQGLGSSACRSAPDRRRLAVSRDMANQISVKPEHGPDHPSVPAALRAHAGYQDAVHVHDRDHPWPW